MVVGSWSDWLAWAGIALPLAVIAWTAWRFTMTQLEIARHQRFERFFSVTDKIGQADGSVLSKVAALYELRRFPEYAEVIVRMTERPDIRGSGWTLEILAEEFRLTNEAMKQKL